MYLRQKLAEQEKLINNQTELIEQLEIKNTELQIENDRMNEKYNRLKLKVRQRLAEQEGHIIPINNYTQLQHGNFLFNLVSDMINNMREALLSTQYEDAIINNLYPDPDNMTYEQLLDLQEKIGYVSKGLPEQDVEVRKN
jgi:hypothetical protein